MKQVDIFMESEGNSWLERNRERLGLHDPVSEAIEDIGGLRSTARVLEVGCSNGWRLAKLRDTYGCMVCGVDPSMQALIEAAGTNKVPGVQCGAANLRGVVPTDFNVLIYGFCLYMTDPEDWLRIAAEGDSVLRTGGYLIIHDFYSASVYARAYGHRDGMRAYHYDFAALWLAHPVYSLVRRMPIVRDGIGNDEMVTVLRKTDPRNIKVYP